MRVINWGLGLLVLVGCVPALAQQDARDTQLGGTISSGAADRATASLEAKNNPEFFQLSKRTGEDISSLKEDFAASKKQIASLDFNKFSEMKLASKEFKLKYSEVLQARTKTKDLESAIVAVEARSEARSAAKHDSSTLKQKLGKIEKTVNSFAPQKL
jgi:BMFP domain-containing protein YqiC